jgi:hypothetical protein
VAVAVLGEMVDQPQQVAQEAQEVAVLVVMRLVLEGLGQLLLLLERRTQEAGVEVARTTTMEAGLLAAQQADQAWSSLKPLIP